MKQLLTAFAKHNVFANILLVMVLLAGALGAMNMVREPFPEFSMDRVLIRVVWPGQDPEEVEEGISRKIEEAIEGIEGIKEYNSTSAENLSTVLIEVLDGYDMAVVKERIRNAVDSISTFTDDMEPPVIEELVLKEEVLMLALSAQNVNERFLKEWSESVKDELQAIDGLTQVQVLGNRKYEIGIEISEEKLREYNLSLENVAGAIRASNLDLSGGILRTEGEEIRLRTLGRKYTGAELAEIVVYARPNGDVITLDRIATIKDDFEEDRLISRFNGDPASIIAILKTPDEDALGIAEDVKAWVEEENKRLPEGMKISVWADFSILLEARIDLLVRNGVIGLVLVFALLWMFLDLRLSFWAGMGMPISVAGALFIMYIIGATINMISLFGLIMVLGIIVDDAIIVGEAIYVARKNGAPPLRAAIEGVTEVGMPVLAAVTTTIVAFVPLAYVSGIMGKFIAILPTVVISCLLISLVECLVILPAHLNHLPDPNDRKKHRNPLFYVLQRLHKITNGGMEWLVHHVYEPAMEKILHFRYVTMATAIFVMLATLGLIQGGVIKFIVFPEIDSDFITATVEFPSGTPLTVTNEAINHLVASFDKVSARHETSSGDPLVKNIFQLSGQTISDDIPQRGNNLGSVRIELLKNDLRGIYSEQLMAEWEEEFGGYPGIVAFSVEGMSAGPPGKPIEIWVQGHEQENIFAASEDLKAKLNTYEGLYQIQHDFRPGKTEMRLSLKPEARSLGITVADLARQVYAGYFGVEAVRLQRGRDDVRVRVRYPSEERKQITDLKNARIRTAQGFEVPLLSVANIHYAPGFTDIKRTDGMRKSTVVADVNTAVANAQDVFNDMEGGYFEELMNKYPGLKIALKGEKKNMTESLGSLFISFPLAVLCMYIIISTIFRSYVQPLLILITVPFGVVGAVLGHILLGYALSMMSLFGMVALAGVVVNDAIVLIERVNEYLADGMPFKKALRKGGARRFRAIALTSLSTVGGLTPLIMEKDLQAQFLIPMAVSIAGGVAFATILTLVILPCMIYILNDFRLLIFHMLYKKNVARELLEPARYRRIDPDEIEEDDAPDDDEDMGSGLQEEEEPELSEEAPHPGQEILQPNYRETTT